MTGLLLKDFYSLRSYLFKQFGLMAVVYVIIGISMKSVSFITPMLIMSMVMILLSCFSIDESSHFYSYALTLPLAPCEVVKARYVLFFGLLFCGTVVVSLLCTVVDMFTFREGAGAIWGTGLSILIFYAPVCCVLLPLIFKLGIEKARMWMMLFFMIPFFLVIWGASWLKNSGIPLPDEAQLIKWLLPSGCAAAVLFGLMIYVSYRISVALFSSKEF